MVHDRKVMTENILDLLLLGYVYLQKEILNTTLQ